MSGQFKVCEIVIGQNFVNIPRRNGMECEIIGGLMIRSGINHDGSTGTYMQYRVQWADGTTANVQPYLLRRRRPPASDSNERAYMQQWRDMADKAPQRTGEPA